MLSPFTSSDLIHKTVQVLLDADRAFNVPAPVPDTTGMIAPTAAAPPIPVPTALPAPTVPSTPLSKTTSVSASGSKAKRSADPTTPHQPPKRKRKTIADSFDSLSNSLESIITVLASDAPPSTPTPHFGVTPASLPPPSTPASSSAPSFDLSSPSSKRKTAAYKAAVKAMRDGGLDPSASQVADCRRLFRGTVELAEEFLSFDQTDELEREAAQAWLMDEMAALPSR